MPERLRCIAARIVELFEDPFRKRQFIVNCTDCRRNVPIGTAEFPFHSISVVCALCGATDRYRPSEIAFGIPDEMLRKTQHSEPLPVRRNARPALISLFR